MAEPSELQGIVEYTFLWHTSVNPCKRCAALNGIPIRGQDLFQPILYDSNGLPIWDLDNDIELTHPHGKCFLEVIAEVDLSKAEWFMELQALPGELS